MRIDRVHVQNFGSYRDATFEFPTSLNLIYAENAGGKSTLCDAIRWGLLGAARGTDARGVGVDRLFHTGTDGMTVEIDLQHDEHTGHVERTAKGKSTTLQVGNNSGPIASQQAVLLKALSLSEDVLHALLDSRAFLDLGHQDAKAVLLKALSVRVTIDEKPLTLEQLETKYEEAFEQRRTAKAALNAVQVPGAPKEAAPNVEALQTQLDNLRAHAEGMVAATSKDDGRRAELERQHTDAANDLARVEQAIEKTDDLSQKIEALETNLFAITACANPDAPIVMQARSTLVDAAGRLTLLQQTITAVETHDPKKGCVLDANIPCKTPAKEFSQLVGALEARVAELTAAKDEADQIVERYRKAASEKTALDSQIKALRDRQAARERLVEQQAIAKVKVDRLHDDVAKLPAPAATNPELGELQARIARGEQTIREARDVVHAWGQHQDGKKKQAAAAKKVADLEARVELLGPKGARVQALAQAIEAFESVINSALERFGYELHFALDPWDVKVNGRSAIRLSESERLRVGLSLQIALAEVTKVGFVLIDGADVLTPKHRAVLSDVLSDFDGQALITVSREDKPAPIDGVSVFWLEMVDGATRVTTISREMVAA